MSDKIERCQVCDEPTGHAGTCEDSVYIDTPGGKIGPLCQECVDGIREWARTDHATMTDKPEIQRYYWSSSGMLRRDGNGPYVEFSDLAPYVASQVKVAVEGERKRWMENEGGNLLDAARRVAEVQGHGCDTRCKCERCSTLRNLDDARKAAVRAAQQEQEGKK